MPTVRIEAAPDGTVLYAVDAPPGELPPVRGRDLEAAWAVAREAAERAAWGEDRAFRFRRGDGGWTELALRDADARCWASAVDRAVGMRTGYGLSVCLRLLALVDLLGRAPWAAGLVQPGGAGALPAAVLRLAAEARLTDDAGFDEPWFAAGVQAMPGPGLSSGG